MGKFVEYVNSDNIRAEMARKKLTYEKMAEELGYNSGTSFKNILDGVTEPTISNMNKISEVLEKPVQYFFTLNVQ